MAIKQGTGVEFDGIKSLDKFYATITESLKRKYIRQGMTAVGSEGVRLAKAELSAHGIKSRGRKGKTNKDGRITKGLVKSLTKRPSAKWRSARAMARQGIIGIAFGPGWPDGAHGHLVEFGHEVVSHGKRTGKRTTPKPFLRPAQRRLKPRFLNIMQAKLRSGLAKEAAKRRSKNG